MNEPIARLINPATSMEIGKRYALISKEPYTSYGSRSIWTMRCSGLTESQLLDYKKMYGFDLVQEYCYWYKIPEDFPSYNGKRVKGLNI